MSVREKKEDKRCHCQKRVKVKSQRLLNS
ncbi:MAG: DUF1922 domain-containing protein [Chloroflexi bacterium]|nr:DUF1922 domain-containing protein [Chloroflexota bacterium]